MSCTFNRIGHARRLSAAAGRPMSLMALALIAGSSAAIAQVSNSDTAATVTPSWQPTRVRVNALPDLAVSGVNDSTVIGDWQTLGIGGAVR